MTSAANVIVAGAGMAGVGAALALQARGFDVLMIDRTAPGNETSYGNAGIIQGEAREPYGLPRDLSTLWRIMCKRDNSVEWSIDGVIRNAPALLSYWSHSAPVRHSRISQIYALLISRATADHAPLIAASGSEPLIRREGYRAIFHDQAGLDLFACKAELLAENFGVGFETEDGDALLAAEPALKKRIAGAVHWLDAWACNDPGGLVKAYAALFRQRGGEQIEAQIIGTEQREGGWSVHSSAGRFHSKHVVVSLGPWSPEFLSPFGYRIPMVRKRGYHMHFEDSAAGLRTPLLDVKAGAVYAPMQAGLRIATGADLSPLPSQDRPRQLKHAYAQAAELFSLGKAVETAPWSGVRPCMPDMLPVVGRAPRHDGLWFHFGHGHHGFTLGPTTGELLAGLIAGDADPIAAHISPSRSSLRMGRG